MKQLMRVIDEARSLIEEGEEYIIFNDGKAIECSNEEDIEIGVGEGIDFEDYLNKNRTPLEREIYDGVKFLSQIIIKKDMNLKLIHICDDVKYIRYIIDIAKRTNVNITNVYAHVESDVKIKFEFLVHHLANVNYREYQAFINNATLDTSFYILRNNNFNYASFVNNKKASLNNVDFYLLQEGTNLNALNVTVNKTGLEQINNLKVYHLDANTKSEFTSYGVADNNSSIKYEDLGQINNGCVASDLKQKTKGILVDKFSSIEANPALVIDENDVLASHGASIGAVDPEDLYYLMSRGLTKEDAEKLIIEAYVHPYFKGYEDTKLSEYIKKNL